MVVVWLILGLLIVGAIALAVIGLRQDESEEDPLQERLAEYVDSGREIHSLEEVELEQPFTQRVILPLARTLGSIALKFTPQSALQAAQRNLELAGRPSGLDASTYVAMRFAMAVVLGFGTFLLLRISPNESMRAKALPLMVTFAILGYFLPELWLRSKISKRQEEILKAMPDALDLLTICVGAGLGFDAAMHKVVEKWDNELAFEFGRVLREVQLGKTRREALRDMADRVGLPEMTSFVAAIIQSEQLGVSLGKVLQIQAENMRIKRRQRAEEAAQQAPVKMLFPLVFLVMPALFIVLLGPAAMIVIQMFVGGGF